MHDPEPIQPVVLDYGSATAGPTAWSIIACVIASGIAIATFVVAAICFTVLCALLGDWTSHPGQVVVALAAFGIVLFVTFVAARSAVWHFHGWAGGHLLVPLNLPLDEKSAIGTWLRIAARVVATMLGIIMGILMLLLFKLLSEQNENVLLDLVFWLMGAIFSVGALAAFRFAFRRRTMPL